MANTKISALTANTNPNWWEELVYAYNNANGKMTLNTMKTFANTWQQAELVSGTNIKTINGNSILWSWNLVISWWGGGWGDSSFDAVVDAGWGGDYTSVSAAIAAGNYNIFVKNWSYTETAWWDPYSNNKSFLHIVGESESGVNITFPSTATTANWYLIDMRYGNAADFYMENISFNITLTSTNNRFYIDNWWTNFIVKNCSFTYTTNVGTPSATQHTLFYSKVISEDASYLEPWRMYSWLYWCYFKTETTKIISICRNVWYYNQCKFASTAWRIQLVEWNWKAKLYNCYADVYELGWCYELELYDTYLTVSHNVYNSNWYEFEVARVDNSQVKFSALQNTPSITLWFCTNSTLDFGTQDVAGASSFNEIHSVRSNCRIKCWQYSLWQNTHNCDISATSLKFYSSTGSKIMTWNRFRSTLTSITVNTNNVIMDWNQFDWTWTISITSNNNVITSNIMAWMSISDTWTGNQKANNITA